jgi:hypothetical protein
LDSGQEVSRRFIVTGGDSPKLLELAEEISMRWRALYISLSKMRWILRLLLGGIISFSTSSLLPPIGLSVPANP